MDLNNNKPRYWDEGHLSLSAGGFMGIYHTGVVVAFKRFAPQIVSRKVFGSSAGALAALHLVIDYSMESAIESILKMSLEARKTFMGPFHPNFNMYGILKNDLFENVHPQAHRLAAGRLHISLTQATTLKNEIVSDFETREDFINYLLATAYIPYLCGIVPQKAQNRRYVDGALSGSLVVHDEHTITVSPFCGHGKINPAINRQMPDSLISGENMKRLFKALAAMEPADLKEVARDGYRDALAFIREHDLFACDSCAKASADRLFQCPKCEELRREADRDSELPERYTRCLDEAEAQRRNQQDDGLMAFFFKCSEAAYQPVGWSLSLVSMTYQFWSAAPGAIRRSLWGSYNSLSESARKLLSSNRDVCGGPGCAVEQVRDETCADATD